MRRHVLAGLFSLALLSLCRQAPAQTAPDPTRFEAAILAFEAQDRQTPPPTQAIVLTGSSSIARWNTEAAAALAPLTVIPRGFGGSVMGDLVHYLDRVVLTYRPRAVLIYEGDNDTGLGIPADTILSQLNSIVTGIHERLPETRIYVLSVKPSPLRWAIRNKALEVNAGYQALAERDPLVHYVDVDSPLLWQDGTVMEDLFVADRLHLNDLGNLIWGSAIRAALMPLEARAEIDRSPP